MSVKWGGSLPRQTSLKLGTDVTAEPRMLPTAQRLSTYTRCMTGRRAAAPQSSAFKHGAGAQLRSPLPLIASLQLFDFSLSLSLTNLRL